MSGPPGRATSGTAIFRPSLLMSWLRLERSALSHFFPEPAALLWRQIAEALT